MMVMSMPSMVWMMPAKDDNEELHGEYVVHDYYESSSTQSLSILYENDLDFEAAMWS